MPFSDELEKQLIDHEGLRLKPYRCPAGKLTIGVGRNLDGGGISKEEALMLLRNDIGEAIAVCSQLFPLFQDLSDRRQRALIDMAFNLGETRFRKFVRLRAAVVRGDFAGAADEMLKSKWAAQVGKRAQTLAAMMREG